ncbi:ribosomal protein L4 [Rhizodiscina lignyota]|uniref:Large ribosomal subunit protein uL4m n=1 Tax=Rhizodiscina lignyota TaxID=1504668 RepID=A0A9P4IMC6_9PEZI|nr:ribosomal protein L4 [Rhizodiscina lignyota]
MATHVPSHVAPQTVLTTLYDFPTLEPLRFLTYPSTHLYLPPRKDLLYRAVVFEGDASRQGTASTKWRTEVHGSGRKIRPQKGSGKARLGDKKSPMLRGGGRAFGPKPRDFSTDLPKKMYDIAWRTALSYRYRRGELIVVDSLNIGGKEGGKMWIKEVFGRLGWGQGHRRSTIISSLQDAEEKVGIFSGLEDAEEEGRALLVDDVDVKDLLKTGRLVVEKRALDWMLKMHQSDLVRRTRRG